MGARRLILMDIGESRNHAENGRRHRQGPSLPCAASSPGRPLPRPARPTTLHALDDISSSVPFSFYSPADRVPGGVSRDPAKTASAVRFSGPGRRLTAGRPGGARRNVNVSARCRPPLMSGAPHLARLLLIVGQTVASLEGSRVRAAIVESGAERSVNRREYLRFGRSLTR